MARVPLLSDKRGPRHRFVQWYARRRYGEALDLVDARAHHRGVLAATVRFETTAVRWRTLDPTLQCLALQATAGLVGCPWCVDIGYWEAHHSGTDRAKIRDVTRWRDSDAYTPRERLVLEYAEAMTVTPPAVTDELVTRLRDHLSDEQLVELTALVAVENQRARTGMALGLTPQGFSDRCERTG